jgi:hypothetical protein
MFRRLRTCLIALLRKDYDSKGSVAKMKSLVVILKGLGAKTN